MPVADSDLVVNSVMVAMEEVVVVVEGVEVV